MRTIVLALILIIIAPAFAGCVSEVDETHPFSGEWTAMGGHLMLFMEGDSVCNIEWNVINYTAENVNDCIAISGMKTVTTWNYSFVGDVLFMQSTSILIEDSDGNTTTTDTSDKLRLFHGLVTALKYWVLQVDEIKFHMDEIV